MTQSNLEMLQQPIAIQRPEGSSGSPSNESKMTGVEERLDLLRQLRAEIQDLQSLIQGVRDGRITLATYASYIDTNHKEIDSLLTSMQKVLPDGEVAEGDSIRHIINQWQMLTCSPIIATPGQPLSTEDQIKELALCDRLCQEIVVHIGHLTIPNRLNGWLKIGWNGYLLSFHDLFADELPRLEDRQRLLGLMASAPGMIQGGIVEPKSGLIFPYHHQWLTRLTVCILLFFVYLVMTVAVGWVGYSQGGGSGSVFTNTYAKTLLLDWLLVIMGVVAHYAIARSKASGTGGTTAMPLGHLSYVIDARAGVIALKGLLMLVGFCGLLFLTPGQNHGYLDFFLVGYSLDSFVGIVSNSLDQRATSRGAALAKQMG